MSKVIGGIIQQNLDGSLFGFVRLEGQDEVVAVRGAAPANGALEVADESGNIKICLRRHQPRNPRGPVAKGKGFVAQDGTTETQLVGFPAELESGIVALGLSEDKLAPAQHFSW